MRIPTKFTYDHTAHGRVITDKSQTVPNDTLSLRELLDRHARGLPVTGNTAQPTFTGEPGDDNVPYLPNLKGMDLEDVHKLKMEALHEVNELKQAALSEHNQNALKMAEKAKLAQQAEDERLLKLYEERKQNEKH